MPVVRNVNVELDKLKRGLKRVEREAMQLAADELANLGESILTDSNELCPVDTGELRNSARAYLMRGSRKQRVAWVEGATSGGGGTVKIGGTPGMEAAYRWELEVSYTRYDKGFDVANFTHENLNPHGGSPPAARVPGTGPKYLERAYIKNIAGLERRLENRMNQSIKVRYNE